MSTTTALVGVLPCGLWMGLPRASFLNAGDGRHEHPTQARAVAVVPGDRSCGQILRLIYVKNFVRLFSSI